MLTLKNTWKNMNCTKDCEEYEKPSNNLLRPHTPSWNEKKCDQCEKETTKMATLKNTW